MLFFRLPCTFFGCADGAPSSSKISSLLTSFGCSFSYSSMSLFMTWPSFNPPCPMAASAESQSWKPYLICTLSLYCGWRYLESSKPFVLQYSCNSSFPRTIFSSLNSFLNHWLILFFACELFTIFNQSRLGPLAFWEVTISTRSPFCRI